MFPAFTQGAVKLLDQVPDCRFHFFLDLYLVLPKRRANLSCAIVFVWASNVTPLTAGFKRLILSLSAEESLQGQ